MKAKHLAQVVLLTSWIGPTHAADWWVILEATDVTDQNNQMPIELVRDTTTDLIWLRDANWAWNSGQQPGTMTWDQASAWAGNLKISYSGQTTLWRLPTVKEMANLRDHQASSGLPIGTGYSGTTDPGPFLVSQFIATQTADAWAADEVSDSQALYMDMDEFFNPDGLLADKSTPMLTWGAVMVPEPQTWALLLAGLGLLGWRTQRAVHTKSVR